MSAISCLACGTPGLVLEGARLVCRGCGARYPLARAAELASDAKGEEEASRSPTPVLTSVDVVRRRGLLGVSLGTDRPLGIDDVIRVIRGLEGEDAKLFECRCSTFTESGNPVDRNYRDPTQLDSMHRLPNPSIGVRALFVDPRDMRYRFTVGMAANARGINCFVDDEAQSYIDYTLELDEKEREAAERRAAEQAE